jgi:hypothetical protein
MVLIKDGVFVALGECRTRVSFLANPKSVALAVLLIPTFTSVAGGLIVDGDNSLDQGSASGQILVADALVIPCQQGVTRTGRVVPIAWDYVFSTTAGDSAFTTASKASRNIGGSVFPRTSARRKIPAQAFELK